MEENAMAHVIARLKVKEWDQFEKAFSAKAEARKARGCERVSIYRDPADRNSLVLYMKWGSSEAVRSFLSNPELKQYQKDVAGVIEGPQVTIYEDSDVIRTN
jgi:quinol monooxygenase YgiN